jgi:hypothetical protein
MFKIRDSILVLMSLLVEIRVVIRVFNSRVDSLVSSEASLPSTQQSIMYVGGNRSLLLMITTYSQRARILARAMVRAWRPLYGGTE